MKFLESPLNHISKHQNRNLVLIQYTRSRVVTNFNFLPCKVEKIWYHSFLRKGKTFCTFFTSPPSFILFQYVLSLSIYFAALFVDPYIANITTHSSVIFNHSSFPNFAKELSRHSYIIVPRYNCM